jgi:hypothetical protein
VFKNPEDNKYMGTFPCMPTEKDGFFDLNNIYEKTWCNNFSLFMLLLILTDRIVRRYASKYIKDYKISNFYWDSHKDYETTSMLFTKKVPILAQILNLTLDSFEKEYKISYKQCKEIVTSVFKYMNSILNSPNEQKQTS